MVEYDAMDDVSEDETADVSTPLLTESKERSLQRKPATPPAVSHVTILLSP